MSVLKDALKRLVNVQKDTLEKEKKAIERMIKTAAAAQEAAKESRAEKGLPPG